jgi:molybdenum cofactor cytidylyltransferase
VLPTVEGKRGNPVLWSRDFFPELATISGDTGARHLLGAHEEAVERVEIGAAAGLDVDTPEALRAAGGELDGPA